MEELEATHQFITESLAKEYIMDSKVTIHVGTVLQEEEGWETPTHHGLPNPKQVDNT